MYTLNKVGFGFRITFGDLMSVEELQRWVGDTKKVLGSRPAGAFGVFVDMRTLKPLSPEAQAVMVEGQKLYKEKGMQRSAVILNSALLTTQFKRLAKESGIYAWERYLDASSTPDWERKAESWITAGTDPDK